MREADATVRESDRVVFPPRRSTWLTDDDIELCGACNGSGEGYADGTRCRVCRGRGEVRA